MDSAREQLALRARETATQLLGALEAEQLVPRFVDSYVMACDRPGLKASPLRYRELLSTLQRECLLAMVARMSVELPQHLTRRQRGMRRGAATGISEAFHETFLTSLAESLDWTGCDRGEFRRDLALYVQLAARQRRPMKRGKPTAAGPFVDRCALLLDPALLEKARDAAARFLVELEGVAESVLTRVFGRRRGR